MTQPRGRSLKQTTTWVAAVLAMVPVPAAAEVDPDPGPPSVTRRPESMTGVVETAPADPELEGAVEDAPGGAGDDAPKPPPSPEAADTKGFTGVRGRITDVDGGIPLGEASVEVLGGRGAQTTTDLEGRYSIPLPPGTYVLRVSYPFYRGVRLEGVEVRRGAATVLDPQLALDDSAIREEVVEVTGRLETKNESGTLVRRQRAVAVSDAISAQEISRAADSHAGAAVRRVVSVMVEDDKYVYVRGLGGRYVTVRLNRFPLPSIEPDRQAVPFEMFPSAVLSTLNVYKTYTADLPGEFGGGTLDLETSYYPEQSDVRARLSTTFDTDATFSTRNAYRGGSLDYFGYDDGSRALPGLVPGDRALPNPNDDPEGNEAVAESFPSNWVITGEDNLPNLSAGVSAGGTVRPGRGQLGYLATAGFSHSDGTVKESSARVSAVNGFERHDPTTMVAGSEKATVSGLVDVGYRWSGNHGLQVALLHAHTGEDEAAFYDIDLTEDPLDQRNRRLRFVERGLTFGQLIGDHTLPSAGALRVRWQGNASRLTSDEPDNHTLRYGVLPMSAPGMLSARREFMSLRETSYGAQLDLELPLGQVRLGTGAAWSRVERAFDARLFELVFVGEDPAVRELPPDQIFSADHLGEDFQLAERTLHSDAYDAEQMVSAGYLSAEWTPVPALRLVGGARVEHTALDLTADSRFKVDNVPAERFDRREVDWLPSASVIYALSTRANLRAAYSYTLARPRFRELAPFVYVDFAARRAAEGTPDLETTRIHNGDLRAEWFPGDAEVFAISAFYKRFQDPIEITVNQNRTTKTENAAAATAWGAELEARVGLGRVASALRRWRAGANLALIWSQIELYPDQVDDQTNGERPMQGQAPYMANANLGYADGTHEVNLFYNVIGARIAQVGLNPMPDVYAQAVHRLDLSASRTMGAGLTLKLTGRNLLGQGERWEQADFMVFEETRGVTFSAGVEWQH